MLRLKQAMDELKIPQQEFVKQSGWSKTQVSLTLNSGKLPANADKFRADVMAFIEINTELTAWLAARNLLVSALWENLTEPVASKPANLDKALCEVVGQVVLVQTEELENIIIDLARIAGHLMKQIRQLAGTDAPYTVNLENKMCEWLLCTKLS